MSQNNRAILFFDGDCGLCNRSVQFIMRHDRNGQLLYAPLQGTTAEELLAPGLRSKLSTVVYQQNNGGTHLRSTAVLKILIDTNSIWKRPAQAALWIPKNWRDAIYRWVANRRHRFFTNDRCAITDEETSQKILR